MGERGLITKVDVHGNPNKVSECFMCGHHDKQNKVAIRLVDQAQATEQQVIGDVCWKCAGLGPQLAANLMVQVGERLSNSTSTRSLKHLA